MLLFQVTNIRLDHAGRVVSVPELTLRPGSRVHASGEAGHIARRLLRGELQLVSDGDGRGGEYTPPRVRHLSPKEIEGSYADATQLPWDDPDEVILLEECLELRDPLWTACFGVLLSSAKLESFAGAVVICTSNEARSMSPLCSQSWVFLGSRLLQEPCLEVFEDALNSEAADELIQQCRDIDYCNLSNWMNDATKKDGTVVIFAARESDGSLGLRGFLSYRMVESRSEFHIAFIFVPREFRHGGYGGRLVRWAISKAQRMPKSKCAWVSLEAADDDLVLWYEKFGFTDMTCGHDDDPDALIWMEAQNSTIRKSSDYGEHSADVAEGVSRRGAPGLLRAALAVRRGGAVSCRWTPGLLQAVLAARGTGAALAHARVEAVHAQGGVCADAAPGHPGGLARPGGLAVRRPPQPAVPASRGAPGAGGGLALAHQPLEADLGAGVHHRLGRRGGGGRWLEKSQKGEPAIILRLRGRHEWRRGRCAAVPVVARVTDAL